MFRQIEFGARFEKNVSNSPNFIVDSTSTWRYWKLEYKWGSNQLWLVLSEQVNTLLHKPPMIGHHKDVKWKIVFTIISELLLVKHCENFEFISLL